MDYINSSFNRLKEYCEREDFKGWDPYDGLNSKFFLSPALKKFRIPRLFWIQLFKQSPVNLRNLLLVPGGHNPKGLALFLSGYVNLFRIFNDKEYKERIDHLIGKLMGLQNKDYRGCSWGYNFDWQSRTFFIPQFTPNVVVSTFVGQALLDVYEMTGEDRLLEISRSICNFILNDLNRSYDDKRNFCFSYSPLDKSRIINASLLASRFLARVYHFTDEVSLKEEAKRSVQFCVDHQMEDGSWHYGLDSNQKWIDSYHTGYDLEALYEYQQYAGDGSYCENYRKGLRYYLSRFFTEEGLPKYYADSVYPIDVHSTAQLLLLLAKTESFEERIELINRVLDWTIRNMQHKDGYFYYQMKRLYKIKIPYIRWSQAWMFYALSWYMRKLRDASQRGAAQAGSEVMIRTGS